MIPGRSPGRQLNHQAGPTSPKGLDVLVLVSVVYVPNELAGMTYGGVPCIVVALVECAARMRGCSFRSDHV